MNKILFLIPHPDDEIVGACKIIKNFQNKKKKIFILFLTNGVIDKNTMWSWDRKKYDHSLNTRLNEMRKSMNELGVKDYFVQNIPSRNLKNNISTTFKKIKKIIEKNLIDTIFCPSYEGGHQDHDVANFICSRLKNLCKTFEFAEYNYFGKKINSNSFFDNCKKTEILKLNENDKKFKKKCLRIYKSEKKNLNYVSIANEVYRELPEHDYKKPPHIGILFYRRFSLFSWHPRVDQNTPEEVCQKIMQSEIF